ncbi:MAG: sulfotransferase [Acidimicrobiales bacterium]
MLFVLSTGRSGSRTIANVLSQSPAMACTHEPVPRLIEEVMQYRYGELDAGRLAELLTESRPASIDGRRYGEAANRLSMAVPVLATAFPEAQFLWLVRDGREVVSSGVQRGWFGDAADTAWERWRMRADLLGEVTVEEWAAWTPFRRVAWLWARTNRMIGDDLAALAPERWMRVRLEDLEERIDAVAAFLGLPATAFVIPTRNARGSTTRSGDPGVNQVDRRFAVDDWTTEQRDDFASFCGPFMDECYPDWRNPRDLVPDTMEQTTVTDPEKLSLDEIRAELADLQVLRGELNLLVEHVRRVDRRHREALAANDRLERAHLVDRQKLESEIVAARDDVARVRASLSFRLGHRVVRATTVPRRIVGAVTARVVRLRSRWRAIPRRTLTRAAANPAAVRVARRLPRPVLERLQSSSRGRSAVRVATSPVAIPVHRLGLRAVLTPGVDRDLWGSSLDVVDDGEDLSELTHLDLVLHRGGVPSPLQREVDRRPDVASVDVFAVLPPLPAGLTPRGFHRDHDGQFLALTTRATLPTPPDARCPGRSVLLRPIADLPDPVRRPWEFSAELQRHVALVDDASMHDDAAVRAVTLLRVAATGLPVVVSDPAGLDTVAAPVVESWVSTDPRALTDTTIRDQVSHRQRNLVHDHYGRAVTFDRLLTAAGRPGLRTSSVSVTVATNRPSTVAHWARLLAGQDHPDFEVIAALHGDGFSPPDEDLARRHLGDRLTIVRADARATLGDALNAAADRARGDAIVKWDDDDLYDTAHLRDLMRARAYSGDLVGKAAEFVYLGGADVTVRRIKNSTESSSPTIGGPTLTIGRDDLRELGGWRRFAAASDSLLIDDVRASGGSVYRTSGLGFVMVRAGSAAHAHTWSADDAYFLRAAVDQRPGLDLAFAAVRCAPEVAAPWS